MLVGDQVKVNDQDGFQWPKSNYRNRIGKIITIDYSDESILCEFNDNSRCWFKTSEVTFNESCDDFDSVGAAIDYLISCGNVVSISKKECV